jgi:hypothetical protein
MILQEKAVETTKQKKGARRENKPNRPKPKEQEATASALPPAKKYYKKHENTKHESNLER